MTRSKFDRLGHLRKRAHSLRLGLLARLGEYASDFPSGTPSEMIDLLKKILVSTEDQVDSSTDERLLEQTCRAIQALGSLLAFFDNAHTAQTPRGLAELVDELMQKLQPDSRLMVWPQADFNYNIRDVLPKLKSPVEHLLPAAIFEDIFREYKAPLNLVSFPRIQRDNVLLHATFGHELGHPIADRFLAKEKGTKKYGEGLHNAVLKLTGGEPKADSGNEEDLDRMWEIHRLHELRDRGLQELISDCVGVLLFGFSAVFAAYDTFTVGPLDALPDNTYMYPPRRFRLRVLLDIANRLGHTSGIRALRKNGVDSDLMRSVESFLHHAEAMAAKTDDLEKLKADEVIEIAYAWVQATLEDAISFAVQEIGPNKYDVKRIEDEVPELIDRIDLGLPPNEIGRFPSAVAVDWRSSILAAWLYKIHGTKLAGTERGDMLDSNQLDDLNRLTLKAVEYTNLQQRYSAYKTGI